MIDHYVKFVRHADVEDHLALGWMPTSMYGGLVGTPHEQWAFIMVWPCRCELRQPFVRKVEKRAVT